MKILGKKSGRGLKLIFNPRHVRNNWGSLLTLILPLAMTFEYDPTSKIRIVIFLILGLFLLISWVQSVENVATIEDLNKDLEIKKSNLETITNLYEDIPKNLIATAFEGELNLTHDDRISLYRFNVDEFICVARYAKYHDFNALHRPSYPLKEGFIGKAMRSGEYIIENLPDPQVSIEDYIGKVQNDTYIPRETIIGMTMKSRSYFCKTLHHDKRSVAVLVVESTQPNFRDRQLLERWVESDYVTHLTEVVYFNTKGVVS